MSKINFTAEHRKELMDLAGEALISGATFRGSVGTELNVHDLFHNTNVTTLQRILSNNKKEITETGNLDEWSLNDYQQRKVNRLEKASKLVNLIIGFRKKAEEEAATKSTVKDLKSQLETLKRESMTPEARIAELEAQILAAGPVSESV